MLKGLEDHPAFFFRNSPDALCVPEMLVTHRRLTLKDVYLDFAGTHREGHPIHDAIARLREGSELRLEQVGETLQLYNAEGEVVGRLSKDFKLNCSPGSVKAKVLSIIVRKREDSEGEFQERLRCSSWEVVLSDLSYPVKLCHPKSTNTRM